MLRMFKHIDISVSGKVQGVFFRATAKEEAEKLDITGYARNMSDGTVYIEAEGEDEKLELFTEWCKSGPAHAEVKDISAEESHEVKGFKAFDIE